MTAEDNIWVRIMRAKYLKTHTFLACPPKPTNSPVWKSLLKSRKLIRQGMVWKVATGETISFWFDNWIRNHNLIQLLGIEDVSILDPGLTVSAFISNKRWNIDKLQ